MLQKSINDFKRGLDLYYVWAHQAYHDITAKYKRTVLGSFWIAGSMLVTSFSFAIIFGQLFHLSLQDALPYTMAGILVFGLVAFIFGEGAEMFLGSGGIIKNHAYPFTFYAFHTVCKNFFLFLHNLVVYFVVMATINALVIPNWTILPGIAICLIFMFTWGMLLGMLASRFRDMRFMLAYMGQIFSILTPIFWRTDGLHGAVLTAVNLNPMYVMIQIVREPLLGIMPSATMWNVALGYTGLGILLWLFFFSAYRRRIPFWV
jgi:ABC-type polysaccharide/polyol phosphate export permease